MTTETKTGEDAITSIVSSLNNEIEVRNIADTALQTAITEASAALTTEINEKQNTITESNKLDAGLANGLASVATTGSYNNISNKPTILNATSSTTVEAIIVTNIYYDITACTNVSSLVAYGDGHTAYSSSLQPDSYKIIKLFSI